MSDRDIILGRVRAALADVPGSEPAAWSPVADRDPAAAYRRTRPLEATERTERFVERCADYAAVVTRCTDRDETIAATIRDVAARHGAVSFAVAADITSGWLPAELDVRFDDPLVAPLSLGELDEVDGVLSGCQLAIADTGTITLNAGPGQGRRALTLVPGLHICVVRAVEIVTSVPEAIAGLDSSFRAGAPVTLISGPSATSDIELTRVEGVHGPRRLEVIVAG